MKKTDIIHYIYQKIIKPFFFCFDAEMVHNHILTFGSFLGSLRIFRTITRFFFFYSHPSLEQKICNINFRNPLGLAAGFDYNAQLPQILLSVGFGFNTVGTITNMPYGGNPKPMLGRLPKSRSLLVNKGFKNNGVHILSKKLKKYSLEIPLGISIGRTNSTKLKTVEESIADIIAAFLIFEKEGIQNSYYELNISCPNLLFAVESFSDIQNLDALLQEIQKLQLQKPIFIKMPLERSNEEIRALLKKICEYSIIKGVIFGNLQKDKNDPSFDKNEVMKFSKGYFSGKPCEKRSNELIKLAYQQCGTKLIIIGCGGVFNAQDAYVKIRLGASLIQLITGMIYEGPQVIGEINRGLVTLMKQDGFTNISQVIGVDAT